VRKRSGFVLRIVLVIFLVVVAGFVAWGETPAKPMHEALVALRSDAQVTVTTGRWLVFSPTDVQPTTGLIFYPGGRVDYRAYAPAAHQIAAQGYLVVIVRMPLNLAVLGAGKAAGVIAAYPAVQHWAVSGHSLGGAMAANFAKSHPTEVAGLLLWAAYPASGDDLSSSGLHVTSVYGTLDGLATGGKIDASRSLLPVDTIWVAITGGNHAQFGWYGSQPGDNPAGISRADQQTQIVATTINLLDRLK
jgi:pimeloyl-ACP methyl ester carboxylesterase